MIKKFLIAEKSEINEEEGTLVGWGSKPGLDRDKEYVTADAWKLDSYRKNPVVMLAHNYDNPPVGKCMWIKSDSTGLKFKAKFANTERGKEIYQLYRDGMMNAFSVGFSPNAGGVIDGPKDAKYKGAKKVYTDVELLEISCVAIPANSSALVEYVKSGKIQTKQLKDELISVLDIKDDEGIEIETKDAINIDEIKDDSLKEIVKKAMDQKDVMSTNAIMNAISNALPNIEPKIDPKDQPPLRWRYCVDIFPTNYPDGYVVYSDSESGKFVSNYFKIDYTIDPKTEEVMFSGLPIPVEQSYAEKTYGKPDETKENGGFVIKFGSIPMSELEIHLKIEVTDDFIHIPAPGEEGEHKDHKIRTIDISKKEGIQGHYCIDCKSVIGYVFAKDKDWDKEKAVAWVKDHTKAFEVESADEDIDNIVFKGVVWDEEGEVKFIEQIEIKGAIPYHDYGTADEGEEWDAGAQIKGADIATLKAICAWVADKPTADLIASDFKLPHHRASDKKAVWKGVAAAMAALMGARGGVDIPEADVAGVKSHLAKHYKAFDKPVPGEKEFTDIELKSIEDIVTKASVTPAADETEEVFIERCIKDDSMKDLNDKLRENACQLIWDKKKATVPVEVKLTDGEIIKTLQTQLAELKCMVEAMGPKRSTDIVLPVTKTADSEGNPSLYDLMSAISNALNDSSNRLLINPNGDPNHYYYVVDVYVTEFPNGHSVYSDSYNNEQAYYQIDYTFDIASRKAMLTNPPKIVLQSWIEGRYGKTMMTKEVDDVITKEGRILSDANRQLLQNVVLQMREAIDVVSALVSATEPVVKPITEIAVEDLFKDIDGIEIEEIPIVTKDDDIDIEIPEVVIKEVDTIDLENDTLDIDENVVKDVIKNAFLSMEKGIDVKGMVTETIAKRMGKVIL